VSFLHRFGSALNPHMHFHCCVLDGVFEAEAEAEPESGGAVRFREAVGLSAQEMAAVQAQLRRRVLRGFVRRGWLAQEARGEMQRWAHNGGFSLDAAVRIEGGDREGLERLLRYCARPPLPWSGWRQPTLTDWSTTYRSPARIGARTRRSHPWSSSTGSPPSSRRPACTGIAITGCWRRTRPCAPRLRR
jgi:hypothetical protein